MVDLRSVLAHIAAAMRVLFRAAGWALLVAIVVLSVVPPAYRPVTGAPHDFEHLAIFVLTGLAFGLGYLQRRMAQAIALVVFSAAVEVIQTAIPGRHARLSDFVVDALSICIGAGFAAALNWGASRPAAADRAGGTAGRH